MLKNALTFFFIAMGFGLVFIVFGTPSLDSDRKVIDPSLVSSQPLWDTKGPVDICMRSLNNTQTFCECQINYVETELAGDTEMAYSLKVARTNGGTRLLDEVAREWGLLLEEPDDKQIIEDLLRRLVVAETVGIEECDYLR